MLFKNYTEKHGMARLRNSLRSRFQVNLGEQHITARNSNKMHTRLAYLVTGRHRVPPANSSLSLARYPCARGAESVEVHINLYGYCNFSKRWGFARAAPFDTPTMKLLATQDAGLIPKILR